MREPSGTGLTNSPTMSWRHIGPPHKDHAAAAHPAQQCHVTVLAATSALRGMLQQLLDTPFPSVPSVIVDTQVKTRPAPRTPRLRVDAVSIPGPDLKSAPGRPQCFLPHSPTGWDGLRVSKDRSSDL